MPIKTITPKAHFVAKTTVVSPPAVEPALLPTSTTATPFPASRKVFVNIAYSEHIPAPPEDVPLNHPAWHLPLILSEPRLDKDKGDFISGHAKLLQIPHSYRVFAELGKKFG